MESKASSDKVYRAGTLTYTKGALAVLFFWLLWGDFCFVLMETIVPGIVPLKLKELGTSNLLRGMILISVPACINLACSPIISFKSDRFRSRWGRRIPFIVVTAPFLVFCIFGLAFSQQIGVWLHAHVAPHLDQFSPATVTIAIMGAFFIGFSFFNSFVNSVFWYLFNDVVPEHLLARFMALFRPVGVGAGALYNLYIFGHAETHFTEIFVGAGLLYLFGFGLMCFKVKEGGYPPPPPYIGNKSGLAAAVKTYVEECGKLPHYWYIFATNMALIFAFASGPLAVGVFIHRSMGLTDSNIGTLNFAGSMSNLLGILVSGWLADKYHPVRVVLVGFFLQMCIAPVGLIWLFWHPSPSVYFYVALALGVLLSAPVGALVGMIDPPLFMRYFPRERYGQFCSANVICRSIAAIISGPLIGEFFDLLTKSYGVDNAYRMVPLWSFPFHILSVFFMYKVYRSWKRHGGDNSYMPPMIGSGNIVLSDTLPEIPQAHP